MCHTLFWVTFCIFFLVQKTTLRGSCFEYHFANEETETRGMMDVAPCPCCGRAASRRRRSQRVGTAAVRAHPCARPKAGAPTAVVAEPDRRRESTFPTFRVTGRNLRLLAPAAQRMCPLIRSGGRRILLSLSPLPLLRSPLPYCTFPPHHLPLCQPQLITQPFAPDTK